MTKLRKAKLTNPLFLIRKKLFSRIPLIKYLRNGNFENGTTEWVRTYVYNKPLILHEEEFNDQRDRVLGISALMVISHALAVASARQGKKRWESCDALLCRREPPRYSARQTLVMDSDRHCLCCWVASGSKGHVNHQPQLNTRFIKLTSKNCEPISVRLCR